MRRNPQGFDLTSAVRAVCVDMAARLAELAHIDLQRVAIGLCRTRAPGPFGVYATLTPLRFAGGERRQTVRGRRLEIERLVDSAGRDFLYLLNLYVPRFLDLSLEQKLTTLVHELWHIGPQFDGDLRRHEGRCFAHGGSRRRYDAAMGRLAQQWLAADPPWELYEFLDRDFAALAAEFGKVRGDRWRAPRLVRAGRGR